MPRAITPEEPVCPYCGQRVEWEYKLQYVTHMNLQTNKQTARRQVKEEIRCGKCGRKAPMSVARGVKTTRVWKAVRAKEDALCSTPS